LARFAFSSASPSRALRIRCDRVTILYDAFGSNQALTRDWGFSALVEHDGKRILFDTGNNPRSSSTTSRPSTLISPTRLRRYFSPSHDHTSGLKYLLKINPDVHCLRPRRRGHGFGGSEFPQAFFRPEPSLPGKMRYFDGAYPEHARAGKLYDTGQFVLVDKLTEVAPGIFLVYTGFQDSAQP